MDPAVGEAKRNLQKMKEQVKMLEDLTNAFEEDREAIERGTQRSILAAQTALHSVMAIPSTSSAGAGAGGKQVDKDIGANLNQRQRTGVGKAGQPLQQQQQPLPGPKKSDDSSAAGGKVPTPPSSPSLGGDVSIRHMGAGPKPPPRAKFSPAGPSAGAAASTGQPQPLKAQGGSTTPRGDGSAARDVDPILVDSLVSILNGEGIPKDMALAAVVATGAESLDAARRWAAGAMGSGRGTLRTVRSLRDAGSTSVRVSGAVNEKESFTPEKFPTPQRQSKSVETTRGGLNLPSPVKTVAGSSVAQTQSTASASTSTNTTGLPGLSPQRVAPPLPWTIPSPTRTTTEAPTVSIQIRCDGGKLVHLQRLFYPTDNLQMVLHELFRVAPQFAPTTAEGGASLCFVVPFPKAKYVWSALSSTTLTEANLCPRGTLVLQRL